MKRLYVVSLGVIIGAASGCLSPAPDAEGDAADTTSASSSDTGGPLPDSYYEAPDCYLEWGIDTLSDSAQPDTTWTEPVEDTEAPDCVFYPDTGEASGQPISVTIAVLGLAPPFGARQMIWDVYVTSPTGAVVTTRRVSATGDAGEELLGASFETTCDPALPGEHEVRVLGVGIYGDPVEAVGAYESAPPEGGMTPFLPQKTFVSFDCHEGAAPRVVTAPVVEAVYADAGVHGVYDLGAVFGDIACHAELACCNDTNGDGACDGDRSWYPPRDDVDWSVIQWRFYCFALAAPQDPPEAWRRTEMFFDDVVIDCGDAGRVAIDPTARQGAPYCDGFGGGATPPSGCVGVDGAETGLVEQVAVDVTGDGPPYIQSHVSMRVGLDKVDLAQHDCALYARATAAHSELALGLSGLQYPSDGGWALSPDAGYPVFRWGAPLTRDGAFVCGDQRPGQTPHVHVSGAIDEPPFPRHLVPGAP